MKCIIEQLKADIDSAAVDDKLKPVLCFRKKIYVLPEKSPLRTYSSHIPCRLGRNRLS